MLDERVPASIAGFEIPSSNASWMTAGATCLRLGHMPWRTTGVAARKWWRCSPGVVERWEWIEGEQGQLNEVNRVLAVDAGAVAISSTSWVFRSSMREAKLGDGSAIEASKTHRVERGCHDVASTRAPRLRNPVATYLGRPQTATVTKTRRPSTALNVSGPCQRGKQR
jgi:hypothetical protein